jgi:hypothetical protein
MTNRNTKKVCKFKISRELVLVIGWRSYWTGDCQYWKKETGQAKAAGRNTTADRRKSGYRKRVEGLYVNAGFRTSQFSLAT